MYKNINFLSLILSNISINILINKICIIFKCEYIQNDIKVNYSILTNFIILEDIILFLFNIINLLRKIYICFLFCFFVILNNEVHSRVVVHVFCSTKDLEFKSINQILYVIRKNRPLY